MDLELVRLLSQWAGAVAVLALLGCFIAAALGLQFVRETIGPADGAFQLVRQMALLGGGAVVTAGLTSTLYWWRLGVASSAAAVAAAAAVSASGTIAIAVGVEGAPDDLFTALRAGAAGYLTKDLPSSAWAGAIAARKLSRRR